MNVSTWKSAMFDCQTYGETSQALATARDGTGARKRAWTTR
jgi:hypothetical protein